jgi:hypothetical protein
LDVFFYGEDTFKYYKKVIDDDDSEKIPKILKHDLNEKMKKRFGDRIYLFKEKISTNDEFIDLFFDDYIRKFFETFIKFIKEDGSYVKYMEICMNKFDIYCLGLVLKESIKEFDILGYFNSKKKDFRNNLESLMVEMTTFNFVLRLTPEMALEKYQNIINLHIKKKGMISKIKKIIKYLSLKIKPKQKGGKTRKHRKRRIHVPI